MGDVLRIDVWSDIACPWCWVGKRHLESALASWPHEVEVVWHSFELDPSAPRSLDPSIDYVERLGRKYGVGRAGAQAMIDRMVGVGASVGLDFRFDRAKPGNTFDAHRLLHWARTQGRQGALKERLMLAYMHEGRSVADPEQLVELAAQAGLDPERAQAVLSSDAHAADVRADEATAAELGISGVPFFVFAGRYGVSGAQPAEQLRKVLDRAWSERAPEVLASAPGDACGPDGCAVP